MRMPSTEKLLAFQLAARTGSFKDAAQLLHITPSAVGARVQSLERQLGIQLFHRGIRRITLTDAGCAYAAEIEGIFEDLRAVTRELRLRFAT